MAQESDSFYSWVLVEPPYWLTERQGRPQHS